MVELLYRPELRQTLFAVFRNGAVEEAESLDLGGERLVPYSPDNNLLKHKVILFPSAVEEYGTEADLLERIRTFIHRYVDLSPRFEEIAAHYALFTWVHDSFNELPYLRVRGDFGSGKSRFLTTVGSLTYRPIFASGASTASPLFRIIDAFRGTLVIDESDFRESDERAEITKIFNNGNARGFPVLRTEVTARREFDPRAYAVFGPKLIATRGSFADRALESRCLTEELGLTPLRDGIPLNLPPEQAREALVLRNQLLLFRFRTFGRSRDLAAAVDRALEPRLNQILAPLVSIIEDPMARESVRSLARQYQGDLLVERGFDLEAQVLEVVRDLGVPTPAIKDIAAAFAARYREEYGDRVTPKWIGGVLRKRLQLKPRKSHGTFVIPLSEEPKLRRLYEKYGLGGRGDVGDVPERAGEGESPAIEVLAPSHAPEPEGHLTSPTSPTSPVE